MGCDDVPGMPGDWFKLYVRQGQGGNPELVFSFYIRLIRLVADLLLSILLGCDVYIMDYWICDDLYCTYFLETLPLQHVSRYYRIGLSWKTRRSELIWLDDKEGALCVRGIRSMPISICYIMPHLEIWILLLSETLYLQKWCIQSILYMVFLALDEVAQVERVAELLDTWVAS